MHVILAILLILILVYAATGGSWLLVPGIFVLVIIATCMMIFALVARFFRWLIAGGEVDEPQLRLKGPAKASKALSGKARVCPHNECRHLNPGHAAFCARCGRPIANA